MDRAALIAAANRAGRASRISGAPTLTIDSPTSTLIQWFAWNDPNGVWHNCADGDCGECPWCGAMTREQAWDVLAEMLADDMEEAR